MLAAVAGLVGCGPTVEPQWSLAVLRATDTTDVPRTRIWLVSEDGDERAFPEVPKGDWPHSETEWIGWSPSGDEIVVRRANKLWSWDGTRLADAPFVNPMWDTGEVTEATVFACGAVVAAMRVDGGSIPGLYGVDQWSLAVSDPGRGMAEILDSAGGLGYSSGDGPTVLWTEVNAVRDPDTGDVLDSTRRHLLLRDETQSELEGPPDAAPVLAPTGDQIAWHDVEATVITDLEGEEHHRIDAFADRVAWTRDGEGFAGLDDNGVWWLDLDTDELRRADIAGAQHVEWSDDGDTLAVETLCEADGQRRVQVFDRAGELWSTDCQPDYFGAWAPDGTRFAMSPHPRRLGLASSGPMHIETIGGEPSPPIEGGFLAFRPL